MVDPRSRRAIMGTFINTSASKLPTATTAAEIPCPNPGRMRDVVALAPRCAR